MNLLTKTLLWLSDQAFILGSKLENLAHYKLVKTYRKALHTGDPEACDTFQQEYLRVVANFELRPHLPLMHKQITQLRKQQP